MDWQIMIDTINTTLAHDVVLWVIVAAILGLIIGSFLNVISLRLPTQLEFAWHKACADEMKLPIFGRSPPPNMWFTRSSCPHCGAKIRPWHNIPVLSYLWLRGKCKDCQQSISMQYPIVELLCGLVSAAIAVRFGFGWEAAWGLLLTWWLLLLAVIDWNTQLLPDVLTISGLWLGLIANLIGFHSSLSDAVIGVIAGYMALWIIYHVFLWITGKHGMGFGDFKLLAMIGAWLGWQILPLVLFIASLMGAIVGLIMIQTKLIHRQQSIAFGPFLALAAWLVLLLNADLTSILREYWLIF